jgi:LAO/AO transport system kinase
METQNNKSALSVNSGVERPSATNANAIQMLRKSKGRNLTAEQLAKGILQGNRTLLSKAITLIESNLPEHVEKAHEIINYCLPYSGNSVRLGITGVPGAGKSSFIEKFGTFLTSKGFKVAVLAVDPSSERSKGSIMGDKTRMESLSTEENAFIRPSPSAGSLGGVARKTRESVFLCEAAGFNVIIIETVGVGQSETTVHSMVDFFLLLMLSGAGDELQGIKRGIMEMADLIAITKADGNNIQKAEMARTEYSGALHLFPPSESSWKPEVLTCSAHENKGIEAIWDKVVQYKQLTLTNGYFDRRRKDQRENWMFETIEDLLKNNFYTHPVVANALSDIKTRVLDKELCSYSAAERLLNDYYKEIKKC